MTKKEWLVDKEKNLAQSVHEHSKQADRLSWCRLTFIVLGVLFFVSGAFEGTIWMILLGLFGIALFGFFYQKHEKLKKEMAHWERQKTLVGRLLARMDGSWKNEDNEKNTHFEAKDHYLYDLDVFGQQSLWTYLCFVQSQVGREHLEALFQKQTPTYASALKNLAENPDDLIAFLAFEQAHSKASQQRLKMPEKQTRPSIFERLVYIMYPLALLASLLLALLQGTSSLLVICLVAGILLSLFWAGKWQARFDMLYQFLSSIQIMQQKATLLEKMAFKDDKLLALQQKLLQMSQRHQKLARLDWAIQIRYNPLIYQLLNLLCLYGGWLYLFSFQRFDIDGESWQQWEEDLGEMEALFSLATFYLVKEELCDGRIGKDRIAFTDLKHPLMNEAEAVGSDGTFKDGTMVITGSNMAGKTTFMRALGLNLVLMRMGLPVVAKSFEAPLLDIKTSMRVKDDVMEGVSTFYGELMRIREMVEIVGEDHPALYLIDEIFKGTNLKDRIIGARAALKKLHVPHSFTFVSTHDNELCEHPDIPIVNIHFQEHYVDNEIVFDYRLKSGPATTTNAYYLMKMIGIIEEEHP